MLLMAAICCLDHEHFLFGIARAVSTIEAAKFMKQLMTTTVVVVVVVVVVVGGGGGGGGGRGGGGGGVVAVVVTTVTTVVTGTYYLSLHRTGKILVVSTM